MKIDAQKNAATLTMSIEGHIDTITAPQLEKELQAQLTGITLLTLDFSKVDYVSSAGLRVILSTEKQMSRQGKMILKNVCDDVMEVFEMTGFNEILTFE